LFVDVYEGWARLHTLLARFVLGSFAAFWRRLTTTFRVLSHGVGTTFVVVVTVANVTVWLRHGTGTGAVHCQRDGLYAIQFMLFPCWPLPLFCTLPFLPCAIAGRQLAIQCVGCLLVASAYSYVRILGGLPSRGATLFWVDVACRQGMTLWYYCYAAGAGSHSACRWAAGSDKLPDITVLVAWLCLGGPVYNYCKISFLPGVFSEQASLATRTLLAALCVYSSVALSEQRLKRKAAGAAFLTPRCGRLLFGVYTVFDIFSRT